MFRLCAWALAIFFAVSPAVTANAESTADVILADLDTFWATQFFTAGRVDYAPPTVSVLGDPVVTSCGTLSASFGPGAYCGADRTLFYSPVWFLGFEADGYEFAQLTVLAHEWAHHIQLLIGIPWSPDKGYELQADCLSGVYANHAEEWGIIPAGTLAESIRLSAVSGDVGPLPLDAPEHGTGAERAVSFFNGYDGGISGCGIAL